MVNSETSIKELDEHCRLHNMSIMYQRNPKDRKKVILTGLRPNDYAVKQRVIKLNKPTLQDQIDILKDELRKIDEKLNRDMQDRWQMMSDIMKKLRILEKEVKKHGKKI